MARFINWGLQPGHSPGYGINHKYIAKELTSSNWKKKAIVRASIYIYITKGTFTDHKSNSKKCIYEVRGHRVFDVDFNNLNEALSYANNYSDYEGTYPKERESSWTIYVGSPMKGGRNG